MLRARLFNHGPKTLSQSAIPFVHLSSGSVSAAGAISGITALPNAYSHAYCFFPANALATTIAAGWHYCTFSTTTAGTAYLDTYTSGTPSIPASPTAVTDGKGAFTGNTAEQAGPTIAVAASAMGPNGSLRIRQLGSQNNTANAKTYRIRFSGAAGTVFMSVNANSNVSYQDERIIMNRGVENRQIAAPGLLALSYSASTAAAIFGSVDTSAATTAVISLEKATATDNLVLEGYLMELIYGA